MNTPFHASGDLRQLKAHAEQYAAFDGTPPAGAERLLALTPGRWRLRRSRVARDFGTATPSLFLPGQGA